MVTFFLRSAVVALALLAVCASDASATHFRYGTIQWRVVNPAQPNVIQFTVKTAWRRSFFGSPVIGSSINPGTFCFGDGACVPMISSVTALSAGEDWVEATFTSTRTYPAATANYIAFHANNARISNLQDGNADRPWRIQTTVTVNMGMPNSSPTSGMIPIVRLPANVPGATFSLSASDPDGDVLSYAISPTGESGLFRAAPAGLTINSSTGVVTWDTRGRAPGGLYAVQFKVTDARGASIPVDVILMLVISNSQPPTMLISNSASPATFTATVGQPLAFTIAGTDPENGVVTLFASGVPPGAAINPSLPANLPSGQTATFTWTPGASQVGNHTVTFAVTDNTGLQDTNSATIVVATVVAPTTTTVTATPDPSMFGEPVTLSATVESTGAAPGSVQFTVDGLLVGTRSLAPAGPTKSNAQLVLNGLSVGTHTVVATYSGATSGGTTYQGSTSTQVAFTVRKAATTTVVVSSLNPSPYGQPVTFTATVTPQTGAQVPAGTVQFQRNGINIMTPVPLSNGVAQVSVASLTAGDHVITAVYSGDSGFESSTGSVTQQVTKLAATVTPAAQSKTYGDADPALTGTMTGFRAEDGVTATYTRTDGESAGGAYTIIATLAPAEVLTNYEVTYNTAAFTILQRKASVTPNSASKTYGDADPALGGTLAGFMPADGVTATYTRTAGQQVGGSYTISATLAPANVLPNYEITYNTAPFTIDKRPASVTPAAATKVYGNAEPTLTGTLNGFLMSDGVSATYTRTPGEAVAGSYLISATLSPAVALGNYAITYNTAPFTITRRPASVTPNAAGKTYGDADPALTGVLAGFVTGDGIVASYSRTLGEAAGGNYTISATLTPVTALENYQITYNTALFSIAKRRASVVPSNAQKIYGEADPALTGTLIGFLPADAVTALYSRTEGETAGGTYEISATLAPIGVLENYDVTYHTAPFTIIRRPAAVSPNPAAKVYGEADPAFSGTLSGFLPADNVTAVYSRTAGETVTGTYVISATLTPDAALGNYAVTYNTAAFSITKKTASVTPNPASKMYGETDPPLTGTLAGFLPQDSVVATYTRTSGESAGGTYSINATLAPAGVLSNYEVTYNTAAFTINKRPATVTPNPASKVFGQPDPVFTGTLAGFVPADNVVATYFRNGGEDVLGGPYVIQAQLNPSAVLSNYDIVYNRAEFIIQRATPAVVVLGGVFLYDGNPHPASGSVVGVGGSPIGIPVFTYNGALTPPVAPGIYNVLATFPGNGNYNPAEAQTIITINAPPIITSFTGPVDPLAVNSSATMNVSFDDSLTGDTHSCRFQWGDGSVDSIVSNIAAGQSTCSSAHTYSAAGVYTVTVTVIDDDQLSATEAFRYVVVFDPSAGFVTGGGSIVSPRGAYVGDPTLEGKATFGFVSKYRRGMTVPTGETQFQFHAGGFNFHSLSYEWLVVSGAKAQYKGVGTVNGGGDYGFLLTTTDGQVNGGGGTDKFRIKVWDRLSGNVVYDNVAGAADDLDAAMQAIAGGSIVIHSK